MRKELETVLGLLLDHHHLLKQPSKQDPTILLRHLSLPTQPDESFEIRNRLPIALLPNEDLHNVVMGLGIVRR
jgi:hypothetical protein